MADFYGADVEQLRQLARELEVQADQLADISRRTDVRVADSRWRGPDSDRFRHDWTGGLAAGMRASIVTLRDAASRAQSNALQQELTSGGFGGVPGQPDWFGLRPSQPGSNWLPWERMPWLITPDGLLDLWDDAKGFSESDLPGLPWGFGDLGQFVPGLDKALNIADYADSIRHGEFPVHEMVGDFAGELRNVSTPGWTPVRYLGGAAIGMWNTTIEEAVQTDWSAETFASTKDFAMENPGEAVSAAAEAVVAFIPDILKNFKFW